MNWKLTINDFMHIDVTHAITQFGWIRKKRIIMSTDEQHLTQLLREGVISEYNLEEKWYKPVISDEAVKVRWKEIIDEEASRIRSIKCSTSLEWFYPYIHGNYKKFS